MTTNIPILIEVIQLNPGSFCSNTVWKQGVLENVMVFVYYTQATIISSYGILGYHIILFWCITYLMWISWIKVISELYFNLYVNPYRQEIVPLLLMKLYLNTGQMCSQSSVLTGEHTSSCRMHCLLCSREPNCDSVKKTRPGPSQFKLTHLLTVLSTHTFLSTPSPFLL